MDSGWIYQGWSLDAQYCRDSNKDCDNCPISRFYHLKDECKMPETVERLKLLQAQGAKLFIQKERFKKSVNREAVFFHAEHGRKFNTVKEWFL